MGGLMAFAGLDAEGRGDKAAEQAFRPPDFA